MADVLIWTTYVIAAVVIVIYGLAACFVAFLRYAWVVYVMSLSGNSSDCVLPMVFHTESNALKC
jgi:Na+/H+-dicarboxylate symporter